MIKQGYKAFHENLLNRYGMPFTEGKIYTVAGPLKFGVKGNGYHFCERLEDTLRYVPGMDGKIEIAKVTALGDLASYYDEYYGYYDMYCTDKIRIDKVLKRKEIISMYLSLADDRVIRFLQGFKLTPEEIELFRLQYGDNERIINTISYYQEGKTDVYEKDYKVKSLKESNIRDII